jgi:transcriptional regulator with GAF, ATPase, and Fis domain
MTVSIDPQTLADSLRRLEGDDAHPRLEESLRRVVDACVQLFGISGSGLMLADEQGDLRYVAASDGAGWLLEEVQIDAGEGPCIDAFIQDVVVSSEHLPSDPRWPRLAERIQGSGIGAVLGIPIRFSGRPAGSLDLYYDEVHTWQDDEQRALERYGSVAETILAAGVSVDQAGKLATQLNYALSHRAPIERGIGYLMARDQLTQTQAFARLRQAARNNRRKIGDVAADLLTLGRLPDEPPAQRRSTPQR